MFNNFSLVYLIYYFLFYSFIGWIIDTLYAFYETKVLVNRGILYGPFCPIYAVTAITFIFLLQPLSFNPFLIFMGAFIITSLIEYFTGLILELIFKTKWWDYSHKKFNLHGRISLKISLYWALLGLFFFYFIHPQVITFTNNIISTSSFYLSYLIFLYFTIDFIFTLKSLVTLKIIYSKFNNLKKKYQYNLGELKEKHLSKIDFDTIKERFDKKQDQLYNNFQNRYQRFITAFPNTKKIIKRLKKN
jgi:uncharacterized membrane protein